MTGISTGACVPLHTSTSLQFQGLKGEYTVDDRCWIVKSHHPMLIPYQSKFSSDKVILCVRNPTDVLMSLASFVNTMSHSGQPAYSFDEDYAQWFDWWVNDMAKMHAKYFEILMRHCSKEGRNPIYITRYEDLCSNLRGELEGMYKYLLDLDDLKGTNAQRRID